MNKTKNTFLLLLTAFIWGVAFVAQSVGMDYVGPLTFNGSRFIIGAIFLIPCIAFLDKLKEKENQAAGKNITAAPQNKKVLITGGICCGIAIAAASTLQQYGIAYTTVGKAGFITALYIVIVPILGIFLKKKPRLIIWLSVLLALVGLYFLCMTDSLSFSKGDTLVLLCAFVFSLHIMIIDHFSPMVDGVRMSCIQFAVAGILCGIPALIFEHPTFSSLIAAWAPVLYAGILSCGVAYTLQIVAQKNYDPTVASLLLSLESVFSVLAGWVILHQSLSPREIFGCVLVFIAIILVQLPAPKTKTN
ncbi:DMT family transporter [Frisingicoccus sp.]|uniref:DMT family transporter n=1 Tax=Frisingicoccus sp. TaxID=1918627 RepID=UPI002A804E5D|nr:DMT family transporter [Frisingicoccus sp.]MDY4833648.1 DMT family transporter [Frisingicoccus sp.]MDY4921430.1 DMT family transporter [Frisingicoccus sp.]